MDLLTQRTKQFKTKGSVILHWIEIFLGLLVLCAVIFFSIFAIADFATADWGNIDTFTHLLKTILQLAIGVEIARLLFSYTMETIIELAVFVVARKLLLLEGDFISLILGIVSLVLLFAARHFFMEDDLKSTELTRKCEEAGFHS